ncbi:hypothetical protein Mro03_32780 [Microbispora rosea subsp. rosea]|nr:hypothetical protein Mro03_32780 [Microbispora rosea subsp. rosea]
MTVHSRRAPGVIAGELGTASAPVAQARGNTRAGEMFPRTVPPRQQLCRAENLPGHFQDQFQVFPGA